MQMLGRARGCGPLDPADRKGPPLLVVILSSAFAGALIAVIAIAAGGGFLSGDNYPLSPGERLTSTVWSVPSTPGRNLSFQATPAEEVLKDLTSEEIRNLGEWFMNKMGASPIRTESKDCVWLSGPSGLELIRPKKAEVLAYLAGTGPKPARFARLTAVSSGSVQEYKAGPLLDGAPAKDAVLEPLLQVGDVPYTKRPTEPNADLRLIEPLLNETYRSLAPLLIAAFGNIFPMLDGFTGEEGSTMLYFRNNALSPKGVRIDLVKTQWVPPPPAKFEATWMHPLPIDVSFYTTSPDPAQWTVRQISFCNQGPFPNATTLVEAFKRGEVKTCPVHKSTGSWDVPQRETAPSPAGRHPVEKHGGVSWGPWSFSITTRPSTGIALWDVRFKGERILYELSMQDAQAAYSGSKEKSFFYSDAAWSLSMLGSSLEPGVDCPVGAHYLSAPNWYAFMTGGGAETDPTKAFDFIPICVFEWDEDHTIWRHMQNTEPQEVHGLVRKTVVVRTITTVANYDYITDVKFREDGEIEVHTRFAGYIETRYYNANVNAFEANFSSIVAPGVAGPVHSHLVGWKADLDVAGVESNALRVTKVGTMPIDYPDPSVHLVSKYLNRQYIEQEGVGKSTFVAHPQHPGNWAIVDRSANSPAGNPRGYAVTLGTFSTTQVLPDDHPFVKAMPFTKYHLAVTRYHDDEYRATSPYVQYDGFESIKNAQNLDRFLEDGEDILDQDLVCWIGVGREHIVRQEDLPLVSNFGAGFSLQPWNFFLQNAAASPIKNVAQ